ncbi:4348_t:CDS:2 [Paraglomus brasilianum]|uniref:4348_t:CDS:1 n=1 Tax=Paraglomus brasilianum TaxID=144538 RepID=A0A9N9DJB0_9GLOM|nr:4348_t:CDS:2 [Paraglomus brasilianum]
MHSFAILFLILIATVQVAEATTETQVITPYSEIHPTLTSSSVTTATFSGKTHDLTNKSLSDSLEIFIFNLIVGIFAVWQSMISTYKCIRRRRSIPTTSSISTDMGQSDRDTITAIMNIDNVNSISNINNVYIRRRIDVQTDLEQRRAGFTMNVRNVDSINNVNNEVVIPLDLNC